MVWPEHIVCRQGWINAEAVEKVAKFLINNNCGQYLREILNELNTSVQLIALSVKKVV